MSSLGLEPDELKVVEQTRVRLSLLSNSIQSLLVDVGNGNPLPPASSLEASAKILERNLSSLTDMLTKNRDLFRHVVVRPSTNYPGRAHGGILTQLLRKKPEPEVEAQAERARAVAQAADALGYAKEDGGLGSATEGGGGTGGIFALRDMWAAQREWCSERVALYVTEEADDPFTREEREAGIEKVRTGLRRDLTADEDEDDDDDDDEDEDDGDEDHHHQRAATDGAGDVQMGGMGGAGVTAGGGGDGGAAVATLTGAAAAPTPTAPKPAEPEELVYFGTKTEHKLPPNVELQSQRATRLGAASKRLRGPGPTGWR